MSGSDDESGELPAGAGLLAAALAIERARACAHAAARGAGPPAWGSNEETRARTALLVDAVLTAVEATLRAAEPMLDAAPAVDLFDRVLATGLVHRSGIASVALARAEEHRLTRALERGLAADPDPSASTGLDSVGGPRAFEGYAVHLAEAARIDRIGDPLLPLAELPAEDRHVLHWQVAAILAETALAAQGAARGGNEDATHRAAAAAVARSLAAVDDADGIGPAAMRHAHALAGADGGIDDELLAATLAGCRVAACAALLAVRAGVGFEDARAMLLSPERTAVLLRACGVGRETATAMLLALLLATARDDAARLAGLVAGFDDLSPETARAHVRFARYEPQYRDALAMIGSGR